MAVIRQHVSVFPLYLDQGSKGPAVTVLQIILCVLGFGQDLVFDQEYGPVTAAAVKRLQSELLRFQGPDIDGNFGPKTRSFLSDRLGFSPDNILHDALQGRTEAKFPTGETFIWPD